LPFLAGAVEGDALSADDPVGRAAAFVLGDVDEKTPEVGWVRAGYQADADGVVLVGGELDRPDRFVEFLIRSGCLVSVATAGSRCVPGASLPVLLQVSSM